MDLDVFRGVVAFVAVAEEKSFRRAATKLGVSAAAVSKAVASLEAETGVKLFVRGAREATLTSEGEAFFAHCRPAVASVESGRSALESGRKLPHGELVISAPFVATGLVVSAIRLLRERFPRLTFLLRATDRLARLGEEGVDIAVRMGNLDDSSLVARKVRSTRLVTVAAPAYLARAGTPMSTDELDAHVCIGLVGPRGKPFPWLFRDLVRADSAFLVVDHGPTLLDAVLAGLGVTQLFDFMATPLLRDGKLVELLADQATRGPDVFVVCAPGRQTSARVRAAFDAFGEALGSGGGL